jgi:hypothetical protein
MVKTASGVVTRQGTTVEKSAQFLHPTVNFNWSRVIDQPWLDLWVGVGVMIPTSDFARNKQTQIFSLPIDQTWTFKKMPKPWSIGINTRVQPTFYEKWTPRSPTELRRQVFLFSFGHFLNYRINDSFELCSSTVFDFDRYAGDTETFLRNAVDDRWRLEFFWYPQNSALHNLGLFLQGKFWNPLPENTTVGTQLTIRL